MKRFNTKISAGIVIVMAAILGITSAAMIINHAWPAVIINVLVAAFITYLFVTTYYVIEGDKLIVRCGFITNIVKIDQIKKIAETNNPLSAPAASLDRLVIHYHKSNTVMISPKDKKGLIRELVNLNPKIEVLMKN